MKYSSKTIFRQPPKEKKMTQKILIPCDSIQLEGMFTAHSHKKAVIITHPHPLYGGNMDNHVVTCIENAFVRWNFSSLRFNFRGTGNSTGSFDEGKKESGDVLAAIAYLKEKQFEHMVLAGYSFGARVNAGVVSRDGAGINDHIMVSPPVAFMAFDDIQTLSHTGLIITGETDEIAPPDQISAHIERWGLETEFSVIRGCDHFYSGHLDRLETIINDYLKKRTDNARSLV